MRMRQAAVALPAWMARIFPTISRCPLLAELLLRLKVIG